MRHTQEDWCSFNETSSNNCMKFLQSELKLEITFSFNSISLIICEAPSRWALHLIQWDDLIDFIIFLNLYVFIFSLSKFLARYDFIWELEGMMLFCDGLLLYFGYIPSVYYFSKGGKKEKYIRIVYLWSYTDFIATGFISLVVCSNF